MSLQLPQVIIRRPVRAGDGVRPVMGTTVTIDGHQVPCVVAIKLEAGLDPKMWQVTITLNAGDVIFED